MPGRWPSSFYALLVPIVPFVLCGDRLESWAAAWVETAPSPWLLAGMTAALLASDIFLPVPSSLVSTLAGAQLGLVPAALASWIGLTIGGVAGFGLARGCGRPLVRRLSAPEDLAAMDRTGRQLGVWLLAATRPLPVLAEAMVLLAGTTDMPWRTFLPVLAIGNLAVATAYSALGSFAWQQNALPVALGASVALPVAATAVVRWQWLRRRGQEADATLPVSDAAN